jgi:hypothetical protein
MMDELAKTTTTKPSPKLTTSINFSFFFFLFFSFFGFFDSSILLRNWVLQASATLLFCSGKEISRIWVVSEFLERIEQVLDSREIRRRIRPLFCASASSRKNDGGKQASNRGGKRRNIAKKRK